MAPHGGGDLPEELALAANLALGCAVAASSQKSDERAAANVVDGLPGTRWTSLYEDNQWLSVDLGREIALSHVAVRWEAAYAETYLVQVAAGPDGGEWETLASERGHDGWVLTRLPADSCARAVRILGEKRATQYGFSIWELRIFSVVASGSAGGRGIEEPVAGHASDEEPEREAEPDVAEDEVLGPALRRLVWSTVWRIASEAEAEGEGRAAGAAISDDVALHCAAEASSEKSGERAAANAVDGDAGTRWTSVYADSQWLCLDLGRERPVSHVAIRWEAAYAQAYRLQGSCDGAAWAPLGAETGRQGWVLTSLPPGSRARWLRILCDRRATGYGFSIWEVRVHALEQTASLSERVEECLRRAERAARPWSPDVAHKLAKQAEAAGRAATATLRAGLPATRGAAVAPREGPGEISRRLWLRLVEAVGLAARAASMLLLDLRGQEEGLWPMCLDELASDAPEHYAAGAGLQGDFEAKWARVSDVLDSVRTGSGVAAEALLAAEDEEPSQQISPSATSKPSPSTSADRERAMQGMRVAILATGSRGDFQPFLALALSLASRYPRMPLKVFTDEGHCEGARQFGLQCQAIEPSAEENLRSSKGKRAMTEGDVRIMFQEDEEERFKRFFQPQRDWGAVLREGVRTFRPTLMIYNELKKGFVQWYSMEKGVPGILVALQPQILPTNDVLPMRLARMEQDPDVPKLRYWLLCAQLDAQSCQEEEDIQKYTPESVFDRNFAVGEACEPCICAFSKSMWPPPKDWPERNVEVAGYFKIPDAEQRRQAQSSGAFFGGGRQRDCEEFLKAGTAPVYVGWGSMTVKSSEHMTTLAVEALFIAKRRGILLGGWANLSLDCLNYSTRGQELRDYCRRNVLLLSAAPHEWLFPRCACAVHHGGIGTTHASLAAGLPTVVTPVWVDQFEIAAHVEALQVGVGTCRLAELTPETLAAAIRTCCTNASFKSNARRLGERMSKEDGVVRACEVLERFVAEDLRSGAWLARHSRARARLRERRAANRKLGPHELVSALALQVDLQGKYPQLVEYWASLRKLLRELLDLIRARRLWSVKAASCPALQDDSSSAPSVGRYPRHTLLQELRRQSGAAGERLLVRRRKGAGPGEAWVSQRDRGQELLERVETPGRLAEVMRLYSERLCDYIQHKDLPS